MIKDAGNPIEYPVIFRNIKSVYGSLCSHETLTLTGSLGHWGHGLIPSIAILFLWSIFRMLFFKLITHNGLIRRLNYSNFQEELSCSDGMNSDLKSL